MKNKILVIGANGMLGSTLSKMLENEGAEVIRADVQEVDITNEQSVSNLVESNKPEIIINCAAYTNVNEAEDNFKEVNYAVNATGVGNIVLASNQVNAILFHISTDYVFGLNKASGYLENDIAENPLNEYGKAKLLGEKEVENNVNKYFICRTSWLFGMNGKNFIDTMVTLGKEKGELSIVTDEIGVPTYTKDLSRQIIQIIDNIDKYESGYYHTINSGSCSRFEQAQKIFELTDIKVKLNETTLDKFPRKAKVPNISILLNTKLPPLQSWQDAIKEYLIEKSQI